MAEKTAIIIGAGPAGLTAAYELLDKTDIKPIIYEMTGDIGGISKTINYKGNRIDLGGHRFFSKSDRVMQWWENILPLQGVPARDDVVLGRDVPLSKKDNAPDPEKTDKVMLIRGRLSRIFFLRRFFDYPISLNLKTLSNLGLIRVIRIGLSYIKVRLFPIKNEESLQDFFLNRFGKELYLTFFKDYTEKIWGVPCDRIKAEWGAQRIKSLSVTKAILHAARGAVSRDSSIAQKKTETSLIGQFMYPKLGPGQMWEEVAKLVKEKGGKIYLNHKVVGLKSKDNKIIEVKVRPQITGDIKTARGDYFFSTMPVRELIHSLGERVPQEIQKVAQGLMYRDFMTVGLLLRKLKIKNETKIKTLNDIIPDNWIYVQERDVKLGRLQIFNNWSPYMVKDRGTIWIGLEYFCTQGDNLWNKSDDDFTNFAVDEFAKIDIIEKRDVLDSIVIRMPKAYPAYFGTYDQFHLIRNFTDKIENLFLTGRNGMHRYNNQDHSMLTAMKTVENIINGVKSKNNIWSVNAEQEYHEEK
ncbi:MAG: NAD(P)/FAD-dependent oxidoreductase [Sedimentisphaerales bacterium]